MPHAQGIMNYLGSNQPQSFAGFLDTCSMGNVQLDFENSVAYNVPFPCSGTVNNNAFTTNTCTNNMVQWQQFAEQYANNSLRIRLDQYTHRVIVMPQAYMKLMTGEGLIAGIIGFAMQGACLVDFI